jgi:hypothetical protein
MMFMNDHDIEDAAVRLRGCPNLSIGVMVLARLAGWTNRNSDGWAYWPKPTNAARRLMELLQSADRFDPNPIDVTEEELRRTFTPIKAFLTRQGVDHAEIFSVAPIPSETQMSGLYEAFGKLYYEHPESTEVDKVRAVIDEVLKGDLTPL